METIEENSKYEMSISSNTAIPPEQTRICLVGDVVNDEATVTAAHTFGIPVITSETGADAVNDPDWRTFFVIEEFDGPIFEALQRSKQCIWGPPALRYVASKKVGLMHNARPIYNYAMRGVVTCFTGIRRKDELTKLVNLIHSMGGCIRKDMNSKITHLIATHSTGDKYQYAKTFRLAVVRPDWVLAAWEHRKSHEFYATTDEFANAHKLRAFEGQKICFLSFPPDEHQHMVDVLKSNGGMPTDLDDPECSHVVLPTSIGYFNDTTINHSNTTTTTTTTNFMLTTNTEHSPSTSATAANTNPNSSLTSLSTTTQPPPPSTAQLPPPTKTNHNPTAGDAAKREPLMKAPNEARAIICPTDDALVAFEVENTTPPESGPTTTTTNRSKYERRRLLKRRHFMADLQEATMQCADEQHYPAEEPLRSSSRATADYSGTPKTSFKEKRGLSDNASTPKASLKAGVQKYNPATEMNRKEAASNSSSSSQPLDEDGTTQLSPIVATAGRLLGDIPETIPEEEASEPFSAVCSSSPNMPPPPPGGNTQKRKRDSIESVSQIAMDTSFTPVSYKKPKLQANSMTRFRRTLSLVASGTPLRKMLRPRRNSTASGANESIVGGGNGGADDSIVSRDSIYDSMRRKRVKRSQSLDTTATSLLSFSLGGRNKKKRGLFNLGGGGHSPSPPPAAEQDKSDHLDSASCLDVGISPPLLEESQMSPENEEEIESPKVRASSSSSASPSPASSPGSPKNPDLLAGISSIPATPSSGVCSLMALYMKASTLHPPPPNMPPHINLKHTNLRKRLQTSFTTMLSPPPPPPIASSNRTTTSQSNQHNHQHNEQNNQNNNNNAAYHRQTLNPEASRDHDEDMLAANTANCTDAGASAQGEEPQMPPTLTVVDEHTSPTKPDVKNGRAHILKSDWFWYTIQNGFADEMDYLYVDYLDGLANTPDTDRRDSLPISLNKRKRKRFSQRLQLEGTPLGSGKRRSSVSDLGLLSVSSSLFDYTTSPEKLESVKSICEIETSTIEQTPQAKKSMRFNHFMDFYNTESNYVGILDTIVNLFKNPLEQMSETNDVLLNKSEIKSIFSNFLPIHEVHQRMLERLRAIHSNWSEDCLIGDIILDYRDDLMKAYPPYVNYFEQMKEMLNQCDAQNPRFHAFLKINQTKPECGRQSLADLMIRPVQRLPSVSLLLNDIWKHTNQANRDYGRLEEALKAIKEVMMHINEDKRKTESRVVIFDIFNEIEGCPADLVSSNRNFISKCEVTELSDNLSGRGDALVLHLFSDNIEVCKKRSRGFNTAKSPGSTKPLKHVKLLPLKGIRFVIDITDSPRAFALLFRQDKDKLHSFSINDEDIDKMVYLKLLCKQMAENACRTDTDKALLCRTSQELDIDISDVSVSTLSKAIKLAARTRLKVGRAFSFNKTPSRLKRAVSTMMSSPFGSTNSLTPASQLAQMRLASCNNIHEVVDEEGSSRSNSPSAQSEVLLAPLSVQPTRKNKTSPLGNVGRI